MAYGKPNSTWGRTVLLSGANWGELFYCLPRAENRIMERIERNEPLKIHIDDADRIMDKLDQLFTRLSLSLLVGALIIGVGFLSPECIPRQFGAMDDHRWVSHNHFFGAVAVHFFPSI